MQCRTEVEAAKKRQAEVKKQQTEADAAKKRTEEAQQESQPNVSAKMQKQNKSKPKQKLLERTAALPHRPSKPKE